MLFRTLASFLSLLLIQYLPLVPSYSQLCDLVSESLADRLANRSLAHPSDGPESEAKLPNGLYLVLRVAPSHAELGPLASGEQMLVNDYHLLEPHEREAAEYVVLRTEKYVPLVLDSQPAKSLDRHGRPKLQLQLAACEVSNLAEFTQENLGRKVAILLGGAIVTIHKVREPIKDGRMQITRCTDKGCDAIFSELQKH